MPHYLVQLAYTPEACAAMVRNPQNRAEKVRSAVEKLGGRIEGSWLCFGEDDHEVILQMPDNVSAAAFAIAVAAGGAVKTYKTTPLMTSEEGIEAMRKAATSGYQPPSS
jgi:uncharacterized protein with GYD domain